MKITFDRNADAAYIYLAKHIRRGGVKKQYHVMPIQTWGMVNLDYDDSGRLVGIEVLSASKRLPEELLAEAEITG